MFRDKIEIFRHHENEDQILSTSSSDTLRFPRDEYTVDHDIIPKSHSETFTLPLWDPYHGISISHGPSLFTAPAPQVQTSYGAHESGQKKKARSQVARVAEDHEKDTLFSIANEWGFMGINRIKYRDYIDGIISRGWGWTIQTISMVLSSSSWGYPQFWLGLVDFMDRPRNMDDDWYPL